MFGIERFPTGNKVKLDSDQCDSKLDTKYSLKTHILPGHEGKKFYCEDCKNQYSSKTSLNRQVILFHGTNSLLKKNKKESSHGDQKLGSVCKQCGKSFILRWVLRQHMITHKGEKPYNCEQCFKSFNQKTNLKTHMVVHTGVRAYVCPECKKDFKTKDIQRYHLVKHHKSTSEEKILIQEKISKMLWMFFIALETVLKEVIGIQKIHKQYLSLMKSQPDWFNTQVVAQEVSEFQEMGTEVSHNKKPIINFARNTPKPITCVKPLQKVKTFIENVISPCLESNKKVSNEQNYMVSNINEGKIEMKTIDKRSHDNEKKDYKTIFKYHLSTSIIDKEAALDAVKSVNLYHLANEAVFRGKTFVLKSIYRISILYLV